MIETRNCERLSSRERNFDIRKVTEVTIKKERNAVVFLFFHSRKKMYNLMNPI